MKKIASQMRTHSVALISLVVAVSSLSYNTWRNEQTEANRNVRTAGVELLIKLGELERVVFFGQYDKGDVRGNPRSGWAYMLTIKDLATLISDPVNQSAIELADTWQGNWEYLGRDDGVAVDQIDNNIERLREDTLMALTKLD